MYIYIHVDTYMHLYKKFIITCINCLISMRRIYFSVVMFQIVSAFYFKLLSVAIGHLPVVNLVFRVFNYCRSAGFVSEQAWLR